ncbi:MAG: S8 family serine peptidase [Sphingomonadaceae bacterium]|nr:S8 family serine peptidase [Sphingomonadaceae bacterium]
MTRPILAFVSGIAAVFASAAQAQGVPEDPYMTSVGSWQQQHPDSWWADQVGLGNGPQSAWRQLPADAAPVTVAVIDSGLDWNHLDIAYDNLWKNPGEIPDNGIDDDGNGYIDDVIGWNFLDDSNKPWDHDGHGTFVTGQIAATWNNGAGVAGINLHARIMVLRALNTFGNTRASYVARAIVYAADNGARIINLSVGGPGLTEVEREALRYATEKGVLIVVAAGNDGKPVEGFGLASAEQVITVGAAGIDGLRAPFSNYGPAVDLIAPGVDILSLRARRTDTLRDIPGADYTPGGAYVGADRRYYRASGTSFAAPIVTGIASLLLSRDPGLNAQQVRQILLASARDVGAPGIDQFSGYGMVDAAAAFSTSPDSLIDATITGVSVISGETGAAVAVAGTASSGQFEEAWLEIGDGENPTDWSNRVGLTQPVVAGELGRIPAAAFRGSQVWILRLVVRGRNGQQREARFRLALGS